jgi:hypothetical protein
MAVFLLSINTLVLWGLLVQKEHLLRGFKKSFRKGQKAIVITSKSPFFASGSIVIVGSIFSKDAVVYSILDANRYSYSISLEDIKPIIETIPILKRIGNKLSEIISGWYYTLLRDDPQIEKLSKDRLEVCSTCSFRGKNKWYEFCSICGCPLIAKSRSKRSNCPIDRWKRVK